MGDRVPQMSFLVDRLDRLREKDPEKYETEYEKRKKQEEVLKTWRKIMKNLVRNEIKDNVLN